MEFFAACLTKVSHDIIVVQMPLRKNQKNSPWIIYFGNVNQSIVFYGLFHAH